MELLGEVFKKTNVTEKVIHQINNILYAILNSNQS